MQGEHIPITILQPPTCQELISDTSNFPLDLSVLVLPRVMLWHPLVQFPLLSKILAICPNANCTGKLAFHVWPIGQSGGKQPRLIHDTESTVLLVGAIYKCTKNHTVYSTDPRFLQRMEKVQLPFTLLHRSGFTRTFIHSVTSLVREGLAMQAIMRHIQTTRKAFATDVVIKVLTCYMQLTGKEITEVQRSSLITSTSTKLLVEPIPTNDAIARCFVITFQENELFYIKKMMKLEVNHCLRLDHTFKVASNIGYLSREGKWITQYGSVLIVLNQKGQVVSWQLTNSTSLDEVAHILSDLKDRVNVPENSQLTIYVDNCCHVRKKLQHIFGMDTVVKLDIFHAIQRITRAMSRKHALFHVCMNDFRMVFRHPTDIGPKRTMNTPSSTVMLANIDNFVRKWENAEQNGQKILAPKVVRQLHALRLHIKNDCLSNIEPGGGTNYNEALHRCINPHFNHAGRMGLPLAYAILTILLYAYNCKKNGCEESLSEEIIKMIEAKGNFNKNPSPFGVVSHRFKIAAESEEDIITDEGLSLISVVDVESILRRSISSADLAHNMHHIVQGSPLFSYHMMPFMSRVPSLYFHSPTVAQGSDAQNHSDRLSHILDSCNMVKHVIEGDGNCFFFYSCIQSYFKFFSSE